MPLRQLLLCLLFAALPALAANAQIAPSAAEIASYTGLHGVAATGAHNEIRQMLVNGLDPNARDSVGRTPLHVAVFAGEQAAADALLQGKADPNALDNQRYDPVTIAAVRNDLGMLDLLIARGASAKNTTSPYDGTALIAAAHLGNGQVVERLIGAGAPLDHINNLGWTALIEAVILSEGGPRHIACLRALIEAGVNVNIADRQGATPLTLARQRGYAEMVSLLEKAGAR